MGVEDFIYGRREFEGIPGEVITAHGSNLELKREPDQSISLSDAVQIDSTVNAHTGILVHINKRHFTFSTSIEYNSAADRICKAAVEEDKRTRSYLDPSSARHKLGNRSSALEKLEAWLESKGERPVTSETIKPMLSLLGEYNVEMDGLLIAFLSGTVDYVNSQRIWMPNQSQILNRIKV